MRYRARVNGKHYRASTATAEKIALRIVEASNGRCVYCGEPGHTIDHIVPHRRGGPNIEDNKVLACRRCNCHRKRCSMDLRWLTMGFQAVLRRGGDLGWLKGWRDVSGDLSLGDLTGGHPWQGRD